MAAQEAVERPPGGSKTIMNDATSELALPLIKGIAQAFSGFLGSDLGRGSRTGLFLLLPDLSWHRMVERLLGKPVHFCGHEPGGETDRDINQERPCLGNHRFATGFSSAHIRRCRMVLA